MCALSIACGIQPDDGSLENAAVVDGAPITTAELDRALAQPLAQLDGQQYRLRRDKLEELIGDRLIAAEAKRRGVTAADLLEKEVNAKVQITDAELNMLIDANKSRWSGTPGELHDRVRDELRLQRAASVRRAFVETLRTSADVKTSLPLPGVYRLDIPIDGAAAIRGPASAPVTIIEFTDFHCPYCKAAQSTLATIDRRYGRYLRFIQHDMPIDQIHPRARVVHEAVRCAGEQEKFWEYRDRAFLVSPATPSQLTEIAKDLGLNLNAFDTCRTGQAVREAVLRDGAVGSQLGIESTPTFFINGRQIVGAQPLEEFVAFIESELRSAGITVN
jgi:protein-disulfide isomerase